MGDSSMVADEWFAVGCEIVEAVAPLVGSVEPEGGWCAEYRRRDPELAEHSDEQLWADPVFLLRVVLDNPSTFAEAFSREARSVARQVFVSLRGLGEGPAPIGPELRGRVASLFSELGLVEKAREVAERGAEQRAAHPHEDSGVPERVRRWQGSLLDLSRRNPLMPIEGRGVALLVDEHTLPAVEDVVAVGTRLVIQGVEDLEGVEDIDDANPSQHARSAHELSTETILEALHEDALVFARDDTDFLRKALPDLRRRGQTAREETGASALYLTLGALKYKASDGQEALAPLFLLPVTLVGRRYENYQLHLDPGGVVRVNESLLERLRTAHGFVPEVLRNPPTDHSGLDMPGIFAALRADLRARRLPFEVVADARLDVLQFSTLQMWRDLAGNWEVFCRNPLVRHLALAGDEKFVDQVPEPSFSDVDEHVLSLPLPADGSQKRAVRWATAGRTFVLEGPPGTGKSQTIANLIADAIAKGERVLFVAEKEAALEVVARRLREAGLADLCLDLHSKEQTTRLVRTQLKQAVKRRPRSDGDVFGVLKARQKQLVEALAEHPRALQGREADEVLEVDADARRRRADSYRELSAELRASLRQELPDRVSRRVAQAASRDDRGLARLRHDLRTAHAAEIRELVAEHIDAVLAVTPCLLMTSATVAQYLPARAGLVDIAVFDEASQIRPASAIGAMGRANSVVIVGDEKQMPPTDVFTTTALIEDEAAPEEESILLEAHRVGLPRLRLSWHYRSRSEGLVAFSNERYYEKGLATFPTPPSARPDSGVELRRVRGEYVEGRRKKKLNHVEAEAVVDEVRALLADDPNASIGVVTFNNNQRDHILDKLESDASEEVQAALSREVEPLFVKNLENVQGDERDVILFSLTYSVGAGGRLPTNFGLLTRPGGERRLNVAVTRARVRNVMFCSFEASDIAGASARSLGPAHLRDYMLAAEAGVLASAADPQARLDADRGEIAAGLRAEGLEVVEDLGSSLFRVDLAVRAEGRPWIAVQLDTLDWAARESVGDRDELPYSVLVDGMGWSTLVLVYRAEWRQSPAAVVRCIVEMALSAVVSPPMAAGGGPATVNAEVDPAEAQAQQVRRVVNALAPRVFASPSVAQLDSESAAVAEVVELAGVGPVVLMDFVAASETPHSDAAPAALAGRLSHPKRVEVQNDWRDVISTEGPVLLERAARIIARRHHVNRLHAKVRNSVVDCLPSEFVRVTHGDQVFVWPTSLDHASYNLVRGSSSAHRKAIELPPEEVANAARLVLAESDGACSMDDLFVGMKEVFGFGRLGSQINARFEAALTQLELSGEIGQENGQVAVLSGGMAVRPVR